MKTNYDVNVFKSPYFNVLDTIGCCSLYGYPTLSFTDDKLKYHCMYHFTDYGIYYECYNDDEELYNIIMNYWDDCKEVIDEALKKYIYDINLEEFPCHSRMDENNRVDYNNLIDVYLIITNYMVNLDKLIKEKKRKNK